MMPSHQVSANSMIIARQFGGAIATNLMAMLVSVMLTFRLQQDSAAVVFASIVSELGLPVAIIFFIATVTVKWALPYFEKQTEFTQSQLSAAQNALIDERVQARVERDQYISQLKSIASSLEELKKQSVDRIDAVRDTSGSNAIVLQRMENRLARMHMDIERLKGE